jgi:hypothetical protein
MPILIDIGRVVIAFWIYFVASDAYVLAEALRHAQVEWSGLIPFMADSVRGEPVEP